jgi:hypothetical protein
MALPGQFEVGQLYGDGLVNGLRLWTQPGGVGTTVFPKVPNIFPAQFMGYPQVPMAYPAQYYAGCGHPLNCWTINYYYDPYAQSQMALICCPMCGYIQRIVPKDQYESYIETPIVIA